MHRIVEPVDHGRQRGIAVEPEVRRLLEVGAQREVDARADRAAAPPTHRPPRSRPGRRTVSPSSMCTATSSPWVVTSRTVVSSSTVAPLSRASAACASTAGAACTTPPSGWNATSASGGTCRAGHRSLASAPRRRSTRAPAASSRSARSSAGGPMSTPAGHLQQRVAGGILQVAPRVERHHREPHVVGAVVGVAEDPRRPARAAVGVADREPLEQRACAARGSRARERQPCPSRRRRPRSRRSAPRRER